MVGFVFVGESIDNSEEIVASTREPPNSADKFYDNSILAFVALITVSSSSSSKTIIHKMVSKPSTTFFVDLFLF